MFVKLVLPTLQPRGAGRAEVLHLKHSPASAASPGGCEQLCPYGNKLCLESADLPLNRHSQPGRVFFFSPSLKRRWLFGAERQRLPSTASALGPALYLPQQPRGNISARRKKTLRRNDAAHQFHEVQLINYTATEPCPRSATAPGGCSVPLHAHPEQTQPEERAIDKHVCRTHFTFLNRAR